MDGFWPAIWGWDGWGFVGFSLMLVVAIAGVFAAFLPYQHRQLLDQLEDQADRARIRARLTTDAGVARRFRNGIAGLITRIDGYFGPSRGWQAFDRCLLHAFLYPYLLFILGWSAGATGQLGTIELLLPAGLWERLWRTAALVLVVGWLILFLSSPWIEEKLHSLIRPLLQRIASAFGQSPPWAEHPTIIIVGLFLPFVAVISVADRIGNNIGIIVAICVSLPIAIATFRSRAIAGPSCIAMAVVFAGFGTVLGDFDATVAVVTFFLTLPIANAALDWLSWAVTRWLLRRSTDGVGATRAAIAIAWRLLVDMGVAFVSLCGLAVLLPNAIEATNWLLARLALPTVAWLPLLNQVLESPFTAGLFVTGMLLTTLVPTLLHVVAGLFGVFAVWTWGGRRMAALIPANRDATMPTSDRQRVAWFILRRRLWVLPSILACLPLVAGLTWILTFFTGPIGLFLADLALCGTSWSHGLCPFWD